MSGMQYPFSCLPTTLQAIECTLSPARLARFMKAAYGDRQLALRLCIWNARLCEAFYLPMQMTEVAARNAIHKPVEKRFGASWYGNHRFLNLLPERLRTELERVLREEQRIHKSRFTHDHVVAGLSFGFWLNLVTVSYEHHLWQIGVRVSFPGSPKGTSRQEIHEKLEQFRIFRNRVAHHNAIFDKGPQREYQNMLLIIEWICPDTHWLTRELATVSRAINERPRQA